MNYSNSDNDSGSGSGKREEEEEANREEYKEEEEGNGDSDNSIEPQPQVLSGNISSQHNQQQLTQEEEEDYDKGISDYQGYDRHDEKENVINNDSYDNNNNHQHHEVIERVIDSIPITKPQDSIKSSPHAIPSEPSIKNPKSNLQSNAITNPPPPRKSSKHSNTLPPSSQRTSLRANHQPHLNDIQQLTYTYQKQLSHITISKNEQFMDRMSFDIYKRQTKPQKINQLLHQTKQRLHENNRLVAFNRLIEDANRRLDVKEHLEENKTKLNEEHFFDQQLKKYKGTEWKEIYQERFTKFQNEKQKKQIEKVKTKQDIERKTEEDIIDLCKVTKAPLRVIQENTQRMYNNAMKKRMIKNEQIAMKEREKMNGNGRESKRMNSLISQQENQRKMKRNLEELIKDEDDDEENDLRSFPNPICQTEGNANGNGQNRKKSQMVNNQTHRIGTHMQLNHHHQEEGYNCNGRVNRMNDKEFFSPGGRLHYNEKEAEHIVQEFFTNKLLKR